MPVACFLDGFVGTAGNKPRTAQAVELMTKKGELTEELRRFFMPYDNRADNIDALLQVWDYLEKPLLKRRLREHTECDAIEMLFQALASAFWEELNTHFNNRFENWVHCLFIAEGKVDTICAGFMYTYIGDDMYVAEDYSYFDIIGWEALRYNEDGVIDSYENSTDRIVQRGEFKILDWRKDPRISTLIPKNGKTYLVMAVDDEYLLQRVDPVTGWDIGEDE